MYAELKAQLQAEKKSLAVGLGLHCKSTVQTVLILSRRNSFTYLILCYPIREQTVPCHPYIQSMFLKGRDCAGLTWLVIGCG